MPNTRARAFLNTPAEWPVQVPDGPSMCALAKPSDHHLEYPKGHGTLIFFEGHYNFIEVPLDVFMSSPWAHTLAEPTEIEDLFSKGWTVD